MCKLVIYLLFFLSPTISRAMNLYICTTGTSIVSSCKKCEENGYCKSHPYAYYILNKIENLNDDLKLQNLASILCNYKEVSKNSRTFFEDYALILIYCDDSNEVQFVVRVSFMHRGEIIIKNPKRWQKGSVESNCFVQPLFGNNDYTDILNFDDDIYFYVKDDIGYKNFIKSILNYAIKNYFIIEEFERRKLSYSNVPPFDFFEENYKFLKNLISQYTTEINKSNKQ